MATAQGAQGGQQTLGKILFYRQLEPLSIEKHKGLGVSQVANPFSFLADTHLVPLTVDEFGLAAVCYPIIFDTQSKTPLAVMGLRPGMNVFLGADGSLDPEVYLPAFARRYPFLPIISGQTAQATPSTEQPGNDKVYVCIDRAAKMLSSTPELPFFEGDQPSRYTQEAIGFCREFDVLGRRTEEFAKLMTQHDLFELTPLALPRAKKDGTPDEPQKIGEYLRISEQKLNALPKETFLELRDRGVTAVMHAHLLSLALWPKILSRAARIQAATPLS
ncbi:SapC family protein [Terricaulis silvestris]|uniref:SapC n=1 Tax=Terricaulis silvestris TaxID=2686094 RepID=A0A6I6MLV3_9CAUL|nr:SapC family protein [Terricaulis silvestris]QGZ94278.1 SapC [Terricaulis silvestris]